MLQVYIGLHGFPTIHEISLKRKSSTHDLSLGNISLHVQYIKIMACERSS